MSFLYLNPFVSSAVGERLLWAESDETFIDVDSVNKDVFETLRFEIGAVAHEPTHSTRVRFVVGPQGVGKSHLFSRLRRRTGSLGIFTFASNLPMRSASIIPGILERVVYGMRHHTLVDGQRQSFTQLQGLLFDLLRADLKLEIPVDEPLRYWDRLPAEERKSLLQRARRFFVQEHAFEDDVMGALLAVLDAEARPAAYKWLAGSSNISEKELAQIQQTNPLDHEQALSLLRGLGKISVRAKRPMVLVLDQLDKMQEPEQIDQFERLLHGLLNDSANWYVVISLLIPVFDRWMEGFSSALKGRVAEDGLTRMPVSQINLLGDERESIIRARLASPYLVAARREAGIDSDIYPLKESDVAELCSGPKQTARALINRARGTYQRRCGETPSARLQDIVEARFEDAMEKLRDGLPQVNVAELAERISEAVRVVASAEQRGSFALTPGPLDDKRTFRGVDYSYDLNGNELRVLGHDIQMTNSFPSFLRQIEDCPDGSIVVRDGRVPVSGSGTYKALELFQKRGSFFHLTEDQLRPLHAIGNLVAELNEGGFKDEDCAPEPTTDNVTKCLGRLPALNEHPLIIKILAALEGYESRTIGNGGDEDDGVEGMVVSTEAIEAIRQQLQADRWLMLERLQLRLKTERAISLSSEELLQAVQQKPLSTQVVWYPSKAASAQSDIHILIWGE